MRCNLQLTFSFQLISVVQDNSRVPVLIFASRVAIVLGIGLLVTSIYISNQCLKWHILRLLGAEGLKLRKRVLPVELATLLFPFVVSLKLLALAIVVPNVTNLI